MQNSIRFILDDQIIEPDFSGLSGLQPTITVLNYLRSFPGHKGVKEGCAEGDCGACTVVIAEPCENDRLVYNTVDSCLLFLPMIHGKQLITIENLAERNGNGQSLHPVQELMIANHGAQCGYCTPGIVMSLFGIYKNHPEPAREIIEDALTGNLCRCTGYQGILDAASAINAEIGDHFSSKEKDVSTMLGSINSNKETIVISHAGQSWFKPFSLQEALRLRKENPEAIIVNGSTDIALKQTKKKEKLARVLDISSVSDLRLLREEQEQFVIGSGTTMEALKCWSEKRLPALFNILKVFGSLQIRNLATIGGNIGSASPIGDTLPFLIATGAQVRLRSLDTERAIPVEEFITGYRETAIRPDELITEIIIPKPDQQTRLMTYKVSKRKDLDISTVSAAFSLKMTGNTVSGMIIAYGGMAARPVRAVAAEQFLAGKEWNRTNVEAAMSILSEEFTPISDARSGAEFRKTAGKNLLMKFYLDTTEPKNGN